MLQGTPSPSGKNKDHKKEVAKAVHRSDRAKQKTSEVATFLASLKSKKVIIVNEEPTRFKTPVE